MQIFTHQNDVSVSKRQNRLGFRRFCQQRMQALLFFTIALLFSTFTLNAQSPVQVNGKLKVVGTQLVNSNGVAVQLRGMSSHGLQWYTEDYNFNSLSVLTNSWGSDIFRAAVYPSDLPDQTKSAYEGNPTFWRGYVDHLVDICEQLGIYCMIDWHVLTPGDPTDVRYYQMAKDFWDYMSKKHAGKSHVLYEICNEPNGVSWSTVKSYAQTITSIIRKNDPNTVIMVGSPTWSSDVDVAATDPVVGVSNLMYSFHFYAASHGQNYRDKVTTALSKGLPIFVTEWGSCTADGNGANNLTETNLWMSFMQTNKLSWCNWSYSDKSETAATLIPGSGASLLWDNTNDQGNRLKTYIQSPADSWSSSTAWSPAAYISTPLNGDYFLVNSTVTLKSDAVCKNGTLASVEYFVDGVSVGSSTNAPYSVQWKPSTVKDVVVTAVAKNTLGVIGKSSAFTYHVVSSINQTAYPNGTAWAIPGDIACVNFDNGGEMVAYHDLDAVHKGPSGSLRAAEGADVEGASNLGYVLTGEWLEYTVNVANGGTYDFTLLVASGLSGTGQFHLESNGVAITPITNAPSSGNWGSYQPVVIKNIALNAGLQVLKLYIDKGNFNFSTMNFKFIGGKTFALKASAGANGSITPTGIISVNQGNSKSFQFSAVSGFKLGQLTVDGLAVKDSLNSYTFSNVNLDHTIDVQFVAAPSFVILSSCAQGGAINPAGSVSVTETSNKTFTITPFTGFKVASILVDGVKTDSLKTYTFKNVLTTHTISATFSAIPTFSIKASAAFGGTISPADSVLVNQGDNQTFAITANTGFVTSSILVDATPVSLSSSYTFTNVNAKHTISASFEAKPTVNLALNKSVVVSTTEAGSTNVGGNAVDGNASTRWASVFADPQSITIDLVKAYQIKEVILKWEAASAASYKVEVSSDNANWTLLSSKAGMASGARVDDLTGFSTIGRYVRLTGLTRSSQWGYSLFEFEVYGLEQAVGPKANAGFDQTLTDNDNNGSESVTLNGAASTDDSGTITTYIWTLAGVEVGRGASIVTNAKLGSNTFQLSIIDSKNQTSTDDVLVIVNPATPVNIAKGKLPIGSCNEANLGNVPANATDGNNATRWASCYSDPTSLTIDLQNTYKLSSVKINWEAASAKDYRIDVSSDNTNWTTISTKTGMATGARIDNITGLTASARYIRMYGTARTSTWGYSIYEFEVYGTLNNNVAVTGITQTPATASLKQGETTTIVPTVLPSNATNKAVTYSSSDTSVVKVSATGLVTTNKVGSAIVTTKTQDGGFTATSSISVTANIVSVTGVSINQVSTSIQVGGSLQLVANILPSNASNKSVTWSTSNPSVCTVSNTGLVTGLAIGTSIVSVKTTDGAFVASVSFTVTNTIAVSSVSLTPASISFTALAQTQQLTVSVLPSNASNKNVSYSTNNANVATVSNSGLVTAIAAGSAIITVKTIDGNFTATSSVSVTIQNCTLTSRFNVPSSASLANIDNVTYKNIYVLGTGGPSLSNISSAVIQWSATNNGLWQFAFNTTNGIPNWYANILPSIAQTFGSTSPACKVTGSGISGFDGEYWVNMDGVNFVMISKLNNYAVYFSNSIVKPSVCENTAVTGIQFDNTSLSLVLNSTNNLNYTISPANATDKTVSISNTDPTVATYANGVVTALKAGSTSISVKSNSGAFTSICNVNVTGSVVPVTGVVLNAATIGVNVSSTASLIATIAPSTASNKNVTWSSSNPAIASVSSAGVVTGVAIGATVIKVTSQDGGFIATCNVSVAASVYYDGIATHFDSYSPAYGGCGVPQILSETQNFVALNVFDTPGSYTDIRRPITGIDTLKMGEFSNGRNCGRWVEVIMSDNCNGHNDGTPGNPFCWGGTGWFSDQYNNGKLLMLVGDACGDGNAWCRDCKFHLDLATDAVNKFDVNGTPSAQLVETNFNNRKIKWKYIQAPNYSGDIKIWAMKDSKSVWASIMINYLENGIHGVEQKVGNNWVKCQMNSDMGQAYLLAAPNVQPYRIRVYDVNDKLINAGREYEFSLPTQCSGGCATDIQVAYTTYSQLKSLGFTETKKDVDVQVYPNPTASVVTIEIGTLVGEQITFTFYDLLGRVVVTNIIPRQEQYTLNVKQYLGKGMYRLRISGEQNSVIKTLIVE